MIAAAIVEGRPAPLVFPIQPECSAPRCRCTATHRLRFTLVGRHLDEPVEADELVCRGHGEGALFALGRLPRAILTEATLSGLRVEER